MWYILTIVPYTIPQESDINWFQDLFSLWSPTFSEILWWIVGRAEETSTYSCSRFCTVNCRSMANSYQLSHIRSGHDLNSDLRGGRRVCYHWFPLWPPLVVKNSTAYVGSQAIIRIQQRSQIKMNVINRFCLSKVCIDTYFTPYSQLT